MSYLALHPLFSLRDPFLGPWLDLYETAFPFEERVPISHFLEVIAARADNRSTNEELIAVLDEEDRFAGLLELNLNESLRAAGLYYFAVDPARRGQGLGAQIYAGMLQRCRRFGCDLVVFDLEDPADCPTPEAQAFARRRIEFYQRQGAQLLPGVSYRFRREPTSPGAQLLVMAHFLEPAPIEAAFPAAQALLSKDIFKP